MDILDLVKNAPGLLDAVQGAGVPEDKLPALSDAIISQLGGADGLDFGDLLGGLDLDSFMSRIDVVALASQVGISPDVAESVTKLIGPKVAEFVPGGLGGLGGTLGKLFD